jgi:hypothetical protein
MEFDATFHISVKRSESVRCSRDWNAESLKDFVAARLDFPGNSSRLIGDEASSFTVRG